MGAKKAATKCGKLEIELKSTIQAIKLLERQYKKECGKPKKAKELKKVIKAAKKQVKVLKKALKPLTIKIKTSEHATHDLILLT